MLATIKAFFENNLSTDDEQDPAVGSRLELASAALLIELMNADHKLDERESEEFVSVLRDTFDLDPKTLEAVIKLAEAEAVEATSLYQFTSLVNEHYTYGQKLNLIRNMWRVAFADDKLDKYEEHLIRSVAELTYVSHSDFIKEKLSVRGSLD
ncbi:MAG: TerB family tellurite resistance protein [Pseudohongiellaceae bacterium]